MRLNDVDLHVTVDGQGPPLLLLHGFSGSLRSWDDVRLRLRDRATLIAIDALGHGQSSAPDDPSRYSLEWLSRDLLALLDALHLPSAAVLGYSMGGRMALFFAVQHPTRVRHLILASASPGIEEPRERQQRIASDEALATRIERDGIEAFVAEWERLPLLRLAPHVPDDVRAAQTTLRLQNRPSGLANSLRGAGTGQQPSLWADLAHLRLPVTLLAGELDTRYVRIAERMQALLPTSTLHVLEAAGHTSHVDQPDEFTSVLTLALDNKLTPSAERC
ncbi:MAG TPA: 2-succinyl-6-hydroxy-2,4-cyclohexadiene-1-carboxylate synthase [Chloroflexota bacterium]|nr:2-succinyl-6-hydroxy-2,4-cyclohexadiene-1-carboxylate synthase [Chloroflexota bacterium]